METKQELLGHIAVKPLFLRFSTFDQPLLNYRNQSKNTFMKKVCKYKKKIQDENQLVSYRMAGLGARIVKSKKSSHNGTGALAQQQNVCLPSCSRRTNQVLYPASHIHEWGDLINMCIQNNKISVQGKQKKSSHKTNTITNDFRLLRLTRNFRNQQNHSSAHQILYAHFLLPSPAKIKVLSFLCNMDTRNSSQFFKCKLRGKQTLYI